MDRLWRFAPSMGAAVMTAFVLASQIVSPQHRMIKALIMLAALIIMLRFEMIYSLYFFVFLFPFPSGVFITSTNVMLVTLLVLLWAVRASSTGQRWFEKTPLDKAIIVFIFAHLLSLFNMETWSTIKPAIILIWRQLTAIGFFYLIVTFVNDEKKLIGITKVICLSAGFLALTAVVELLAPGSTLIPGWLSTKKQLGAGTLGYRLEGLRVGGAVASHGLLGDYCTLTLFFMGYLFMRARNPIEKLLWVVITTMTFIVLLATANRGAFFGFAIGVGYAMYVFRHRMNFLRYVTVVTSMIAFFVGAQYLLTKYTIAASVTERMMKTSFKGIVPDSRQGAWEAPFEKAFDHVFFGHGPYFGIGRGLNRMLWPHNSYIFYFYTLGLLGIATFLFICYRLLRMSLLYRDLSIRDSTAGIMMSIMHIQLVMFMVEQLRTDHQRDIDYVYIYIVWMLFGLIAAAHRIISAKRGQLAES